MSKTPLAEQVRHTIEWLGGRKQAYQLTFNKSYQAQRVLIDLAKFCRANASTFDADPRIHAVLEGRREVWLRITQHLNLTPEQLFALYNGQNFNIVLENEDG
jgi:hypothetical protein